MYPRHQEGYRFRLPLAQLGSSRYVLRRLPGSLILTAIRPSARGSVLTTTAPLGSSTSPTHNCLTRQLSAISSLPPPPGFPLTQFFPIEQAVSPALRHRVDAGVVVSRRVPDRPREHRELTGLAPPQHHYAKVRGLVEHRRLVGGKRQGKVVGVSSPGSRQRRLLRSGHGRIIGEVCDQSQ